MAVFWYNRIMNDKDNIEIITESAKKTQKIGEFLAQEIINSKSERKKALIVGLEGDLGSGKTTFIQGMASGFKIKEPITSPTFVILRKYKIPKSKALSLYHIDCYRIESKDLDDLDFKEIIQNSQNVVVVEWAEKIKKSLPLDTLWMKFEYIDKNKREIIIK